MNVPLRQLVDADLDAIYEQMEDPESVRMAAYDASASTAASPAVAVRRSRR